MKVTVRKIKGGATVRVKAETAADKEALTNAVMSGSLMRELNAIDGLQASVDCRGGPDGAKAKGIA